jgi:hypothetical protein
MLTAHACSSAEKLIWLRRTFGYWKNGEVATVRTAATIRATVSCARPSCSRARHA